MENKFLVLTKDHRFRIIEIDEQAISIYRAMVDGDVLTGDAISRDIEAEKRDIVDKYYIIRSLDESEDEEKKSEFTFSDAGGPGDNFLSPKECPYMFKNSFTADLPSDFNVQPRELNWDPNDDSPILPHIIKPFDFLPMHVIAVSKDVYRRVYYDDYTVYKAIMMYLDEQRKDPWNPMTIVINKCVLPVFSELTRGVMHYRLIKYKRGFDSMLLDSAYQKPLSKDYSMICDSPAWDIQGSPCHKCPMQKPHHPSERNKYICPHFPHINYKTCKPAV